MVKRDKNPVNKQYFLIEIILIKLTIDFNTILKNVSLGIL